MINVSENKIIANDLRKIANDLKNNSNDQIENEWRSQIEQNGGISSCQEILNLCKPFLENLLPILKSVNAMITGDSIVDKNSDNIELNESDETNKYNTVYNDSAETSSKRQRSICPSIPEYEKIHSATQNNDASCSYTPTTNILTIGLKTYADRDWDSNVTNKANLNVNIPRSIKKKMSKVFTFQQNNLEDIFFNAPGSNSPWFTKEGISATISFCPNQIQYLSYIIKKKRV